MTADWQRIERLIGADNLGRLAKMHVGIIGLGSGGGFVAQSLAMSGIGHFTLIDPDILDAGNIVRHVADSRDVGRPKVEAVADLIRYRNNQAEVIAIAGKFESHLDALDGLDMVIVGLDNEPAKFAINEALLSRNIPAIYAGVYERGAGGDVVIIRPYDGPCYACWAQTLRDEVAINEGQDGE
ncbi:MAG: ThiF family adenylyltransferase, partial [Chloroflexi bacterium]